MTARKSCYVIQFRDGSLHRRPDGSVWSIPYNSRPLPPRTLQYIREVERAQASKYPRFERAFDCSAESASPIVSRPQAALAPADELALRLIARARRGPDEREVAHDHLVATYPEYARVVERAARAAQKFWRGPHTPEGQASRSDHVVLVRPTRLIEAVRLARRGARFKRSLKDAWYDAFVMTTWQGWQRSVAEDRRGYVPMTILRAPEPRQRAALKSDPWGNDA